MLLNQKKITSIKMPIISETVYRFNGILTKMGIAIFTKLKKNQRNFWNYGNARVAKLVLHKANKAKNIHYYGVFLDRPPNSVLSTLSSRVCINLPKSRRASGCSLIHDKHPVVPKLEYAFLTHDHIIIPEWLESLRTWQSR